MNKGYIDIHHHIIPFVDDGAENWNKSVEMLKAAYDEGIRKIIATPHYHPRYRDYKYNLDELFIKVNSIAKKIGDNFEVLPGNEVYYSTNTIKRLQDGTARTLAGSNYVLIEFSVMADFSFIRNAVYDLASNGYLPVLAHIERYNCLVKNPNDVQTLAEMGGYMQVNSRSVMDFRRRGFVKKLLAQNLISFIATDAHDCSSRRAEMRRCADYISKKFGEAYTKQLFYNNPLKIIENDIL